MQIFQDLKNPNYFTWLDKVTIEQVLHSMHSTVCSEMENANYSR